MRVRVGWVGSRATNGFRGGTAAAACAVREVRLGVGQLGQGEAKFPPELKFPSKVK